MHKLHIVIPIGVSSPGTPIPEFLLNGIESLKQQTQEDILITVAADENISDTCKKILLNTKVNIEWFLPYSYFTKEGIWGKIFKCWEKYESEYVSFLHYDDLWEANKAKNQINFIEKNNLDGCWSQVYLINDNNELISGDSMEIKELSSHSVGRLIPWICHSTVIKRDAILNCGILEYREKWNCDFEWLYTVFLHKIKNLKKCNEAIFLWRQHLNQVSHAQGVNMKEDNIHVKEQRSLIGYSFDETMEDSRYVMENVNLEEIKNLYNIDKNKHIEEYANMLNNVYKEGTNNHPEHNPNPKYWDILLGSIKSNPKKWENKKALDFGCGRGRNVTNLLSLTNWKQVDGIDVSVSNIDFCKKEYINQNSIFYKNNGMDLSDLKDNEYDFIMSTIVFQHICVHELRYKIKKEIYRVLKSGGEFSFQMGFGSMDWIGNTKQRSYFENGYNAENSNGSNDVRVSNPNDLVEDLKSIGFKDITYSIEEPWADWGHPNWIYVKCYK